MALTGSLYANRMRIIGGGVTNGAAALCYRRAWGGSSSPKDSWSTLNRKLWVHPGSGYSSYFSIQADGSIVRDNYIGSPGAFTQLAGLNVDMWQHTDWVTFASVGRYLSMNGAGGSAIAYGSNEADIWAASSWNGSITAPLSGPAANYFPTNNQIVKFGSNIPRMYVYTNSTTPVTYNLTGLDGNGLRAAFVDGSTYHSIVSQAATDANIKIQTWVVPSWGATPATSELITSVNGTVQAVRADRETKVRVLVTTEGDIWRSYDYGAWTRITNPSAYPVEELVDIAYNESTGHWVIISRNGRVLFSDDGAVSFEDCGDLIPANRGVRSSYIKSYADGTEFIVPAQVEATGELTHGFYTAPALAGYAELYYIQPTVKNLGNFVKVFADNFNDADNTTLKDHTPTIGTAWGEWYAADTDAVIFDNAFQQDPVEFTINRYATTDALNLVRRMEVECWRGADTNTTTAQTHDFVLFAVPENTTGGDGRFTLKEKAGLGFTLQLTDGLGWEYNNINWPANSMIKLTFDCYDTFMNIYIDGVLVGVLVYADYALNNALDGRRFAIQVNGGYSGPSDLRRWIENLNVSDLTQPIVWVFSGMNQDEVLFRDRDANLALLEGVGLTTGAFEDRIKIHGTDAGFNSTDIPGMIKEGEDL